MRSWLSAQKHHENTKQVGSLLAFAHQRVTVIDA